MRNFVIKEVSDGVWKVVGMSEGGGNIAGVSGIDIIGGDFEPSDLGSLEVDITDGLRSIVKNATTETKLAGRVQAKIIRETCDAVMEEIISFNLINSITAEQIGALKAGYPLLFSLLRDYQPWSFKALLDATDLSATIITQDLLDDIYEILTDSGLTGL